MTLPRIDCAWCARSIAAGPVAGRPGKGRLFRHDEPGMHRDHAGGVLVSCRGSLVVVDLPRVPLQLELYDVGEDQVDEELGGEDELAPSLF